MEENVVEGKGTNKHESKWDKIKAARNEIEAVIKALVVFLIILFGILIFGHTFPNQYEVILSDNLMFIILLAILALGIILYMINAISPRSQPRSQGTKRENTFVTEEEITKYFTHIIALIITVPLMVVTCILLVGGNHSEELTFVSGLLGVIIGYYFGHRGVESAESLKDIAIEEKKEAVRLKKRTEQDRAHFTEEETIKASKVLSYPKKGAWDNFKKQVKNKYKDFNGVENIDKYLPWAEEPGDGWNDEERKIIAQFEEEWKLLGGE